MCHLNPTRYSTKPTIIAITNIEESPPKANIPKTDSIHKIRKTPATSLKGEGNTPIIDEITSRIRIFHKVIG